MAHRKLTAKKSFRYGTRMLTAGDPVTMSGPQARLHGHLGNVGEGPTRAQARARKRAAPAPAPAAPSPAPAAPAPAVSTPPAETAPATDLPTLRAAYEKKFGKKPFNGWPAATLIEKLAVE